MHRSLSPTSRYPVSPACPPHPSLQALDAPVAGVTSFREDGGHSSAAIDDSVFEVRLTSPAVTSPRQVPRSYDVLGGASENTRRQYQGGGDEEEMMLQYAIRQSLAEPGDQVRAGQ